MYLYRMPCLLLLLQINDEMSSVYLSLSVPPGHVVQQEIMLFSCQDNIYIDMSSLLKVSY